MAAPVALKGGVEKMSAEKHKKYYYGRKGGKWEDYREGSLSKHFLPNYIACAYRRMCRGAKALTI